MTSFTLRAPSIEDVESAARVHVQGWVETYREQLPDEFFGEAAVDHRRRMWTWMLGEGASDDRHIVVAEAVLGTEDAFLWVAKINPRARRFYERNGFRADGVEKPDERVPSFGEVQMTRSGTATG